MLQWPGNVLTVCSILWYGQLDLRDNARRTSALSFFDAVVCRSADDWITYVYDQFNATMKLAQVKIVHNTKYIRYGPSDTEVRQAALDAALAAGTAAIDKWTAATHGLTLLHVTKQYRTP